MGGEAESFIVPFLGALQASIAVLLTIFVGVLAAQFNLLSEPSSKEISKFCVRMSLPALLVVNVGQQLHLETIHRYIPIVIWTVVYNVASMLFGTAMTTIIRLPSWTTPAIAFNNTTSLPLLLVQSLAATGILDSLDSSPEVLDRAKSYFLVNAMIGNSLTFAMGPRLLNGQEEDAPNDETKKDDENEDDVNVVVEAQEEDAEEANEGGSLLPNRVVQDATRAEYQGYKRGLRFWKLLPHWAKVTLDPRIIGAALGLLVGFVPALHRVFFNSQQNGGYFNAWLTSALQNVGDLFAALQVIVVGVKLSRSLLRMKKGESNGKVPLAPSLLISAIRFIIWPAISIPLIYLLATKTTVLSSDPLLWFIMMLMPVGPPAMKLTALADVSGADHEEKMSIAKFLTISYAISPLICFSVVGSLKASQAAVSS